MKNKFFLLVFCIATALNLQAQKKTVLIISLSKNNIRLCGIAEKNLTYNNVSRDSFAEYIFQSSISEAKTIFEKYSVHFLNEYSPYHFLPDSFFLLKQWNGFYINRADSSYQKIKSKSFSSESYHNIYYGVELNDKGKAVLNQAIKMSNCDYVLFINQFEIVSNKTTFSLSCEITDASLRKLLGDKNEWIADLFKKTYYDAVQYFTKSCIQNMLDNVEKYISQGKYSRTY